MARVVSGLGVSRLVVGVTIDVIIVGVDIASVNVIELNFVTGKQVDVDGSLDSVEGIHYFSKYSLDLSRGIRSLHKTVGFDPRKDTTQ
jgi:hypothetical protein